ncbi:putative Alkaline phosphatase, tissue-nonspecific isozyme, partial [Operophtera brumata]
RHYWYTQAQETLQKRLQYAPDKKPVAKNVILVVGDGMSLTTATAARILRGQRRGQSGEDTDLVWDTFPAVSLAKARYETLGLDAGGRFNNCATTINSKVTSLVDWAHDADPEHPNREGRRLDGRNLAEDWAREKKRRRLRAQYIHTKEQLAKLDPRSVDYLL